METRQRINIQEKFILSYLRNKYENKIFWIITLPIVLLIFYLKFIYLKNDFNQQNVFIALCVSLALSKVISFILSLFNIWLLETNINGEDVYNIKYKLEKKLRKLREKCDSAKKRLELPTSKFNPKDNHLRKKYLTLERKIYILEKEISMFD